jgi:hypothetical protein
MRDSIYVPRFVNIVMWIFFFFLPISFWATERFGCTSEGEREDGDEGNPYWGRTARLATSMGTSTGTSSNLERSGELLERSIIFGRKRSLDQQTPISPRPCTGMVKKK